MAQHGHEFEFEVRPSHDGVLRCSLCAADAPSVGYDWCPAAACLICDECCEALLAGDPQRVISIIATTGRVVPLDALAGTCRSCERGAARAFGLAPGDSATPPC